MSLLSKIADRLILSPSIASIDPGENRREEFGGEIPIEAWVNEVGNFDQTPPENRLIVLKVPGQRGRAERASVHPAELLVAANGDDGNFSAAQTWTLNHRGYGGSMGPASISNFVSTLESFWNHIEKLYPNETKLVTGNSLGCVSALYLARRKNVCGLLLRNPPPLKRLIGTRPKYNWWSLGFAKAIARQIPEELNSIENASHVTCPVLFVTSEKDTVVPVSYQQQIIDAFSGESHQFTIDGAEHHHLIPDHQATDYTEAVAWLKERISN